MKLTVKLPAIVGATLLLAVVLTGCEAPPPPPAVTLRIGVFQTQGFLPYYVMQEQGLDKKYGLRFEETPYSGGAAAIDAMAAGTLDLCPGVAIVPLLLAAERGRIPDQVIWLGATTLADPDRPGAGLVVAHSVRGWKDLEGRKIGVNARNSFLGAAAEIRLKQEGVRNSSFVEIPFPNLGLAVAGGNIVAAAMVEPYLTQSLQRGDGKLLDWVIGGPPFERVVYEAIVASAGFIHRNPDGAKAFLRAHLAAVRWIDDHPDQARQVLARRMNLSAEIATRMRLRHWPVDARADPALLEQTQQVLLQAGILKRPVDTRRIQDETVLAEVLKEAR